MATPQQPVIVRLDRSREYSTIHGDCPPGDPHHRVSFYQQGLPYGPDEVLLHEHAEVQTDPVKKERAERLMKRAAKTRKAGGDPANPSEKEAINLASWARGEQELTWQEVTNAIAQRFSKRVKDKIGALECLIEERVVAFGDLSAAHAQLLGD